MAKIVHILQIEGLFVYKIRLYVKFMKIYGDFYISKLIPRRYFQSKSRYKRNKPKNMFRKSKILSALLVVAATATAQMPAKWSLQDCIDYSIEHNIALRQSRISLEESEVDVKSAKAALFPSLSFNTSQNGRYQPYFEDGGGSFVTDDGSGGSRVSTSQDHFTYSGSYGLNASMTLFNGGRNWRNIKQQKLARGIAELSVDEKENALKEQIATLYVQILYSVEAVNVSEASLAAAKKNLESGKAKYEVGKIAHSEVVELQSQVSTAEYQLVNSQTQLANYKLQLKQLLEITDGSDFDILPPESSDELALAPLATVQEAYRTALSLRPEIESSRLSTQSAQMSVKQAQAGYYPTVSLNAGAGTSNTDTGENSLSHQWKYNLSYSVGLSLSVPLYDNRTAKSNIQKAKLQHQSTQLQEQDAMKQLYSTVEGLWLDANSAQKKFVAAQKNVESAQASYDLLCEQFNVGLKNATELLSGRTTLISAQQELLQAKYTAILSNQLLSFYMGGDILF